MTIGLISIPCGNIDILNMVSKFNLGTIVLGLLRPYSVLQCQSIKIIVNYLTAVYAIVITISDLQQWIHTCTRIVAALE